jgi:hypothetical protein
MLLPKGCGDHVVAHVLAGFLATRHAGVGALDLHSSHQRGGRRGDFQPTVGEGRAIALPASLRQAQRTMTC